MTGNTLFFGDNLDILKHSISDASVDLVYLDPPFNSNRSYNLLFKDEKGVQAPSQIRAFEDTWSWAGASELCFDTISDPNTPDSVRVMLEALYKLLGGSEMMAYLAMMTPRLMQLHRVLKPTGNLYLHCDPTASHYLKIVMDTIFGPTNFRNEIVWERTTSKGLTTKRLSRNHDVLLSYQMSDQSTWNNNAAFIPYDLNDLRVKTASKYRLYDSDGRRYELKDLTNPNPDRPNLTYEFLGITKVWRWTKERMQVAYDAGLVIQPRAGAVPRYKKYLDEQRGMPVSDVWTDIEPLNSQAAERLGYPTQKPLALLKRIIETSSNPGDVVLDPFCGCGTTVDAAQELRRTWLGIDVTHLSIALIKNRLFGRYGLHQRVDYAVQGEPRDEGSARALAENDREQFEYWSLSLVEARPWEGKQQKGADKGRDGLIVFQDDISGRVRRGVVSVKSGRNISSRDIRDLRGTIEREKAELGIFVTLEKPTRDMLHEAVEAGMYEVPFKVPYTGERVRRIQILTIAELLDGKRVDLPRGRNMVTLPKATRATIVKPNQASLLDNMTDELPS